MRRGLPPIATPFIGLLLLMTSSPLLGCADHFSTNTDQCTADQDCNAGLTCQFERCAAPGVNRLKLHVRITPRVSDGFVAQHIASVALDDFGSSLDVTLTKAVSITGTVRFDSGALGNVNGTLTARTDGEIPGFPHVFTTKSTGGQGFQLAVLPGREYSVSFRPAITSYPVHTFVWTPAETLVDFETQITLPEKSYEELAGWAAWDAERGPKGAQVSAYDLNGAKLAETLTVGARGYFSVQLPPGTKEVRLRIEAGSDEPLFATTWTDAIAVSDAIDVPIPPAQLPRVVQVGVLGILADNEVGPVARSAVSFELTGSALRTTGDADDFGVLKMELLPGPYWVLVTPPADSAFASTITQTYIDAGDDPLSLTLELAERVPLEGTVMAADGTAVSGHIIATRRPGETSAEHGLVLSAKPIQLELADGVFSQPVDPGVYDLKYIPLETTQAPPQWLLAHDTSAGPVTIQLRPAGVVAVILRTPDGTPLPNAQIRVYMGDEGVGTREYSSGFTDGAGAVSLPVPFIQ